MACNGSKNCRVADTGCKNVLLHGRPAGLADSLAGAIKNVVAYAYSTRASGQFSIWNSVQRRPCQAAAQSLPTED